MKSKSGSELTCKFRRIILFSAIILSLVFAGCKKQNEPIIEPPKDTTPPEITISSPLEQKVYDSNTIPFGWAIEESNFKSAWYSTDNEKTKVPIEKSGTKSLEVSTR